MAVHGLGGHREKTWTVDSINWLRDLLPSDIPNARILSWGYDANTHSTSPISAQYLYDHATTLVSDLCLERRLTKVLGHTSNVCLLLKNNTDWDTPHNFRRSQLGGDSCQKRRSI